ncbi:MAG: long-chain-fatty-acid--CoA ligase [Natronosporangium sp.]
MANLATNLLRAAARHPERPAIRLDDEVHSYRRLAAGAAAVAGWLRERRVGPGDRVALQLPNLPLFAVCYYGILAAGAIAVPLNPLFKPREIAYHLADSQAALLLADPSAAEPASAGADRAGVPCRVLDPDTAAELAAGTGPLEPAARAAEDTAVILYTSGTTGVPKGAELTHANLSRNAEVVRDTLQRTGPEDVIFGGLPLYHSFGQTSALNAGIASGSCLTLLPRFEPGKALEILQRDRVTVFLGVPTMYAALLLHPDAATADLSPLRLCVSGGASLPMELLHGFENRFGCPILEGYGLSETSPVATFNHPDRPRKPGSIGTPIDGVQTRIVDPADGRDLPAGEVGEVWIRGHNVMKGYWRRPEATTEAVTDGWFRTGDLARADPDGYLFIVDRIKDLVIRGGYNVYPREVEEVLYEHPAVAEAAVVGIPHPTLGQEVGAAVALKPGATATAEELRGFVKEQVAPQKYPRYVWLLDELPKGPTGKLLKREIVPPASVTG